MKLSFLMLLTSCSLILFLIVGGGGCKTRGSLSSPLSQPVNSTSSPGVKYTLSTTKSDQVNSSDVHQTLFTDRVEEMVEQDKKIGEFVKKTAATLGSYPEIISADITGDKDPEAIVLVWSGLTGGVIDILVYQNQHDQPVLLTRFDEGYKMDAYEKNGDLYISEPVYEAHDPECCPSYRDITRYHWNGKEFVEQGTEKKHVTY